MIIMVVEVVGRCRELPRSVSVLISIPAAAEEYLRNFMPNQDSQIMEMTGSPVRSRRLSLEAKAEGAETLPSTGAAEDTKHVLEDIKNPLPGAASAEQGESSGVSGSGGENGLDDETDRGTRGEKEKEEKTD